MNLNFNKNKLYKLLRSFYILSGVRIVIYDIYYNEVISYPPNNCSYCKLMDQKKCQLSNNKAFLKCKESDDLYIYHCHANLVEAMINLKINGEIVGFIMFGQISDIASEEKRVNLLKNNTSKNVLSSIQEIKYLDDEKLQSASTILLSLAKYAISEKMVSIEQEKFINQMNDFIEKNYENNSFSHAYIVEVKNYNNLELFLNYFVSKLLDEDNIDINNNGDIYIIKPDNGTIKKNQIDELQKNFFTKSVISKRKVYIMYGADKMNDISANSLLKFIEEPENNIFAILITENRFALLKTILSRCQVLRLKSNNLDRNNDDVLNIIYYASNSARPLDESSYDYVKSIMEKVLSFVDCYEKTGMNALTQTNVFFGKMVKNDIDLFLDILIFFYYDIIRIYSGFEPNTFNISPLVEYVKDNNTTSSISSKIRSSVLMKNKLKYNINGNLLIERLILLFEGRC